MTTPTTPRESLKALGRGLDVLAELNRSGHASTAALARALDLKRPTTHRILRVLSEMGLVRLDSASGLYSLTRGVLDLSRGLREEPWISTRVEPRLWQWTRAHGWPLLFCAPLAGVLTIRVSTQHDGSLGSSERFLPGRPFPGIELLGALVSLSVTLRVREGPGARLTMLCCPEVVASAESRDRWTQQLHAIAAEIAVARVDSATPGTGRAHRPAPGRDQSAWGRLCKRTKPSTDDAHDSPPTTAVNAVS